MHKGVFVVLFSLAAIASAINLSRYASSSNITESDFQQMFNEYINMAPFFVQSSPERYQHFKSKVISIVDHNQDPSKTYKREINQYTGVFPEEFNGYLLMEPQECITDSSFHSDFADGLFDYPPHFDWRDMGIIAPVKNQGNFASCWAFAAAGAIESHWALYMNSTPTLLSEQQLIDCAVAEDKGGYPSIAFEYVKNAGGIETENTYPYAMQQEGCIFNVSVSGAVVPSGSVNITTGDELSVLQALLQHGPVATLMDANDDFTSYTGGIYASGTCDGPVNHAVLIVGYGTDEAGIDYWIGKNSWGRAWGEDGYFRIQRGVNMCGIANCASFPNMEGAGEMIAI